MIQLRISQTSPPACDPMTSLMGIQEKAEVHHHDAFYFQQMEGGKMNLILPRDAPTVVVN